MFYFQNKLLTSKRYIELKNNQNISISNYINIKSSESKLWQKHIKLFFLFNLEIYNFILFSLFYLFCCNMEINILTGGKLGIFFILFFKYFKKTRKLFEFIHFPETLNNVLIIYCCAYSACVYLY